MPYTLMIVDDEPSIREGIHDLIKWEQLGFSITGVYDDGLPALEHLKRHAVDAVITDIKMSRASGLDIARHIHENGLSTKVVLISGYKEVDLAMSAIQYSVCGYILKPIDITKLEEQMKDVREQIDKERQARNDQYLLHYYQKNIVDFKEDFFWELSSGSFANEKYLTTAFQLIYPSLNANSCPCFVMAIALNDYDTFISRQWKHSSGELYGCLRNYINLSSEAVEYRMISKHQNIVRVMGIVILRDQADEVIDHANSRLIGELKGIFNVDADISELIIFDSVLDMSRARRSAEAQDGIISNGVFEEMSDGVSQPTDKLIQNMKQYIVEHILTDISLEDISDQFYMSQYYVSRMFKKKTGENLIDFIVEQKIEKAKELLGNPAYKIYDVSNMVGYKSNRYFSKIFKAHTGFTPNGYRQNKYRDGVLS